MPGFDRLCRLLKRLAADTRFFLMTMAAGDSPESWADSARKPHPDT